MNLWQTIISYFHRYFSIPSISVIDIIEMLIIAFIFYYLIKWFKKTSAWTLFKGIIIVLIIMLLASIFNFSTILWIASKTISVGVIALIIIFQPELRRALEQLGRKRIFANMSGLSGDERFSETTLKEIIKAVNEMSQEKIGALISIEENISLGEYERTGIMLNADISSELLLNIFQDKTPLHDGAVIIREDRLVAATCYLPLSASGKLNKKFGTRHRAALGVSEQTDAFTIVVSEETGSISIAVSGNLIEDLTINELENRLTAVKNRQLATNWFDRFKKGARDNA